MVLVFAFRSLVRNAFYVGKTRLPKVTERQFIEYQPNYASVFFWHFCPKIGQASAGQTLPLVHQDTVETLRDTRQTAVHFECRRVAIKSVHNVCQTGSERLVLYWTW